MMVENFLLTRFLSRSKPRTDASSFCVTPVAASVRMARASFRPRGDSRKFWSEEAATRCNNKMEYLFMIPDVHWVCSLGTFRAEDEFQLSYIQFRECA